MAAVAMGLASSSPSTTSTNSPSTNRKPTTTTRGPRTITPKSKSNWAMEEKCGEKKKK
jgi:hypothetical protein